MTLRRFSEGLVVAALLSGCALSHTAQGPKDPLDGPDDAPLMHQTIHAARVRDVHDARTQDIPRVHRLEGKVIVPTPEDDDDGIDSDGAGGPNTAPIAQVTCSPITVNQAPSTQPLVRDDTATKAIDAVARTAHEMVLALGAVVIIFTLTVGGLTVYAFHKRFD